MFSLLNITVYFAMVGKYLLKVLLLLKFFASLISLVAFVLC